MAGGVSVKQDNTEQAVDGIDSAIGVALEEIGLLAENYAAKKCRSTPVTCARRLRTRWMQAIMPCTSVRMSNTRHTSSWALRARRRSLS